MRKSRFPARRDKVSFKIQASNQIWKQQNNKQKTAQNRLYLIEKKKKIDSYKKEKIENNCEKMIKNSIHYNTNKEQ